MDEVEEPLVSQQEPEIMSFENEYERSNTLSITNIDVVKNNSGSYTMNVVFNAPNGVSRVAFPTWTIENGQDDLLWMDGEIRGNTASYTVDIKDHNFELGLYVTHVYVYDSVGNITTQAVPTQTMTNEAPKLSDIKIDNSVYGQYTITATVTDDYGIDRVEFPTWTQNNGQDDIIWERGTISGNTVTFVARMEDHHNELGLYNTHVYAYDKAGELTSLGLPQQTMEESKIEIKDVETELSGGRYTVTAKLASNDVISSVQIYTWTDNNGQDDLTDDLVQINGDTITYTVDMKDHHYETGAYNTHIYARTKAGTLALYFVPVQNVENNTPEISNVMINNSIHGQYIVTATVTDDYDLDRVEFATWTQNNGQDDLIWGRGTISGNTVTYVVNKESHNNELGAYITHIYAYDKAGELKVLALSQQIMEESRIEIKDVKTELSAGRYTVTAKLVSNDVISSAQFYTWTDYNGQDDMTSDFVQVNGDTITYTVDMKDHRYETGIYNTYINAKTKAGTVAKYVVPLQNIVNEIPTITNVKVTKGIGSYTVTATVTDDYALDYVQVHAWTSSKGQDDLTKDIVRVIGDTITFTVNKKDHNNETGTYYTHIYAYDKAGLVKKIVVPTQVIFTSN